MTVKLTAAQARALGLDAGKQRTTKRVVKGGGYHTRCEACGDEFTTAASEDRHVQAGHARFSLVLDGGKP